MTHSPISRDLSAAIDVLKAFSPYSSHPSRADWDKAMDVAEDVQAQLEIVEALRPGALHRMVLEAHEEVQARGRPIQVVTELIARYSGSVR